MTAQERIARMMDYCHLPTLRGKTVLDVGSGPGWWAFRMEDMGAEVVAADIDDYWIGKFHENKPEDSKVEHVKANVYELSKVFSKQFDVVVAFALLHHVKQPQVALANLCGLAKEMILIECPIGVNTKLEEHKRWGADEQHAWYWVPTVSELLSNLENSGFHCKYFLLNKDMARGYFECLRL